MRFTSQHKATNQKEYGKAVSPLRYDSLALILSWSIFVVYGKQSEKNKYFCSSKRHSALHTFWDTTIVDHEFDDHLNTIPKYIPTDHCRLAVSDITYIKCKEGFVYLSLTMDGYSRIITGYSLQRTLSREGPLDALTQSVEFYKKYNYDVNGLIFHSDRGCQYVSKEMTSYEAKLGIITSVTQTGDPLHNAMAERLNGTIKNDWLYDYEAMTFEETKEAIDKVIQLYNNVRPHRSLGMRTPMQTLDPSHQNPLVKNEGFA